MGKTVSTKVNRQVDSWIGNQVNRLGVSRSEFLKSLIKREMISGGDEAKAPPVVLPAELPDDPEPQTPNDWDTLIELDEETVEESLVEGVEGISERVKALEEDSRDVQKLWNAIGSLKEDQKELQGITKLAINKLVDQAVMNLELSKASLELSRKIVTRLQSEETVPEAPPEEPPEEPTEEEEPPNIYGRILEYLEELEKTEAEEAPPEEDELEIAARLVLEDEAMLDEITGRVLEGLAEDIDAEREEVYREIVGEVRETLSAIRVSDGEKHVRLFRIGQKMDKMTEDLTETIEALTTKAPPKVEARTELEESLKDLILVCDHGGKKHNRIGFTEKDKREGVVFCPRCGRHLTYGRAWWSLF